MAREKKKKREKKVAYEASVDGNWQDKLQIRAKYKMVEREEK